MQAERGGGGWRPRRGGGRQGRRRPGGDRDGQARGRGGAPGGGGRGRRDHRGRRAASPPPARHHGRADDNDDPELQDEEKEEQKGYSRRKIVSNWNRYEDAEKAAQNESGESQRGTDFSVLLSSAGDSFTQFRFAEEKDWETGSVGPKQLSALYIDCQSLVQALQELPLHLRLNVDAEVVQASTPTELPQITSKCIEDSKRRMTQSQQPLGQSEIASVSDRSSNSVLSKPLSKDGPGTTTSQTFQKGCSVSQQEADNLDEELDLLLNLDAPVNVENSFLSETLSYNMTAERDLKMENVTLTLPVTEEESSSPEQQKPSPKNITEEELEDWLDSMIS